jgi:hypothetical protein
MDSRSSEVELLLLELHEGKREAAEELIPIIYDELRRLAAHSMRRKRLGHTLQARAQVHEAFLRLAGQNGLNSQIGTLCRHGRRSDAPYADRPRNGKILVMEDHSSHLFAVNGR